MAVRICMMRIWNEGAVDLIRRLKNDFLVFLNGRTMERGIFTDPTYWKAIVLLREQGNIVVLILKEVLRQKHLLWLSTSCIILRELWMTLQLTFECP